MHFRTLQDPPVRDDPVVTPTKNAPDIDPPLPEDQTDLDQIEKEVLILEEEGASLEKLSGFTEAYLDNGMDIGLNAYGIQMGYLSSTAIGVYGLEALNEDTVTYAREGLASTIKNKVGEWITKIGPTLVATGKAIWAFVTKQISKITGLMEAAYKGIKGTVKAHPFATVAATVATCLGLGAVAPAILRSAPSIMGAVGRMGVSEAGAAAKAAGAASKAGNIASEAAATTGKLNNVLGAIKWPFAKFSISKPVGASFKLVKEAAQSIAPVKRTSAALGWTTNSVKTLGTKFISGMRSMIPNLTELMVASYKEQVAVIKSHWTSGSYFKLAGRVGLNIMTIAPFLGLIWSTIKAFFALVKEIVWGTCRIVATTFHALTGTTDASPQEG